MRARKYTKRIEIWQTGNVVDTYGGNTVSDTLLSSSWASVQTASNTRAIQRLTDFGVTDPTNAIIVKLRHRNDLTYSAIDQYIKYRGVKYIIQNAPVNIDFEGVDVEIIAVRESTKSV